MLRQPIELPAPAPSPVAVTASVGVASGLSGSAEDLLGDADLALYEAKAAGKDGYALFESAMQTAAQDRMHLEMDLAEALEAQQLFLVYQPMFDLRDERVVGVEALLRWRHPTDGRDRARRVHPHRRAERVDRSHRALGARAGVRAGRRLAERRAPSEHRRQRLSAPARADRVRRGGALGPAPQRSRTRRADPSRSPRPS